MIMQKKHAFSHRKLKFVGWAKQSPLAELAVGLTGWTGDKCRPSSNVLPNSLQDVCEVLLRFLLTEPLGQRRLSIDGDMFDVHIWSEVSRLDDDICWMRC